MLVLLTNKRLTLKGSFSEFVRLNRLRDVEEEVLKHIMNVFDNTLKGSS